MKGLRPALLAASAILATLVFIIVPSIVANLPPLQRIATILFIIFVIGRITRRWEEN